MAGTLQADTINVTRLSGDAGAHVVVEFRSSTDAAKIGNIYGLTLTLERAKELHVKLGNILKAP